MPHPALDPELAPWQLGASCRGSSELALADPWYASDADLRSIAVRVCQGCAVRRPCLEAGLEEEHGIWGGWIETHRQILVEILDASPNGAARAALLDRAAHGGPDALNITPKKKRG
jgi:hypothetical protein